MSEFKRSGRPLGRPASRVWFQGCGHHECQPSCDGAWLWEAVGPSGLVEARGVSDTEARARAWVLAHEHPDLRVIMPASEEEAARDRERIVKINPNKDCAEHDL